MPRHHSSITGKFVTKEFAEANPDTTVKLSQVNLREELINFYRYMLEMEEWDSNDLERVGIYVDEYLNEKNK